MMGTSCKLAPARGGEWGWNGEGSSTRGDVSSFRLPAMGIDVFMGTLLGQASLHSVDRTDKYCQLHFSSEGVKPGVGVEGYNSHSLRCR
jgi:hypothetical protein